MATLGFLTEDTRLEPDQVMDVNVLFSSASHMQRLVNDVLDLAKLREGSLKITPEAVRASTFCHWQGQLLVRLGVSFPQVVWMPP